MLHMIFSIFFESFESTNLIIVLLSYIIYIQLIHTKNTRY